MNRAIFIGHRSQLHVPHIRGDELQTTNWLGGLSGYCDLTAIQTIPEQVYYRIISRIQANMTEAKLRWLMQRGSITAEEVKGYKAKMFQQGLDNPYLELESASNRHLHWRYLAFGELLDTLEQGLFDHFGLSKKATIPWF